MNAYAENVVCLSRLFHIFDNLIGLCKYRGKQCGPRSDCCRGSSLILIYAVCREASKTFQQTIKADNFCCDWSFKGQTHCFHWSVILFSLTDCLHMVFTEISDSKP